MPLNAFETITGSPSYEPRKVPTDCTFREELGGITPRVDVFCYDPDQPTEIGARGEQLLIVKEFTARNPKGQHLAWWRVGEFPDIRFDRHAHGKPFTLDGALSDLFGRDVSVDVSE